MLRRELGRVLVSPGGNLAEQVGAPGFAERIAASLPTLRLLDSAQVDDPAVARPALDALVSSGAEAVPVLLHEVEQAADSFVVGRRERATRAILVLGMLGDRRATDVLIRALQSGDGWVRTYSGHGTPVISVTPAAVVASGASDDDSR